MAMYSLGHPKSRSVILKYPFHALTHLRMQNVLFDTYPWECANNKIEEWCFIKKWFYSKNRVHRVTDTVHGIGTSTYRFNFKGRK